MSNRRPLEARVAAAAEAAFARQRILVEEPALSEAERQCLADSDARQARR